MKGGGTTTLAGVLLGVLVALVLVTETVRGVAADPSVDVGEAAKAAAGVLTLLALILAGLSARRVRKDLAALRATRAATGARSKAEVREAARILAQATKGGAIGTAFVRGATNSALDFLDLLSPALALICAVAAAAFWPVAAPVWSPLYGAGLGWLSGWTIARRAAAGQQLDLRLRGVARTTRTAVVAGVGAALGAGGWLIVSGGLPGLVWSPILACAVAGALGVVGLAEGFGERQQTGRRERWATQLAAVTGIAADQLLDPGRPVRWTVSRAGQIVLLRPPAGVLTRAVGGQLETLVAQIMPEMAVAEVSPKQLVLEPAGGAVRAEREHAAGTGGLIVGVETLTDNTAGSDW